MTRDGSHERTLTDPIPALGLQAGDRLEPCETLCDIGDGFDNLDIPPGQSVRILFWRKERQTLCTHRSPLWDASLGITPCLTLAIDLLHTFYLGILLELCKISVWEMLKARVWPGDNLDAQVLLLRAALFHFYDAWKRQHPDKELSTLVDLTPKMLGSDETPHLGTKGAETWGFFLCLLSVLEKDSGKVPHGAQLLQAFRALDRFIAILDSKDVNLEEATIQATIQATIHNKHL